MSDDLDIFFSVIVPCCGIGRYVDEMVASIREQTYGNFECLLMYEESKDNTLELLQKAVAADSRFKLFTGPRSGSASMPRNNGMREAKGKYALFIDGDDWIEKDALERFAKAIKAHGDVDVINAVATEYLEDDNGHREFTCTHFNYLPEDDGRVFTGKEATVYVGRLNVLPYPAIWMNLYRLEFLLENQITCIPGIVDEDEDWNPRVLFLAEKVLVMNYAFYNYRRRSGSAMTSQKVRDLHGMFLVMRSLFAFYVKHKSEVTPEIEQVWQRSWLSLFFLIFFAPHNQHGITEKVRRTELRNLLEGEGLDNFKQFMKIANLPKRIAEPLILLGRWFTLPACLYFKLIYYPLVKLRGT